MGYHLLMAFNLIPKEEKFFELFEAQAVHNVEAAKVFREMALKWTRDTAPFDRLTLTLALSYGGRQELVDAVRRLARLVEQGRVRPEQIDEALLAQQLYAPDLPDPDLIIRTSGEQRLSNFLLWQASYAELYVTPKYWPEFAKPDLLEAIMEFERRERRFGRRTPQGAAVAPAGSGHP